MAALNQVQHVFFDLDDTLWDFKTNSERVLRELYQEFDLQGKLKATLPEFLEHYSRVNQRYWTLYGRGEMDKESLRKNRFAETFSYFGYRHENDQEQITTAYLNRAPKGISLKSGCIEVLDYLKPNYQLHLLTNGFSDVQFIKIKSSGIQPYFNQVIISEEYQLRKPDLRLFRLAEKICRAQSGQCLMIGDQLENDVLGALQAGWQAIHFDIHKQGTHKGHVIHELKELTGLI